MKLDKKVVLVTGGASGIGQAIAKRFLSEGAKVIVFDIVKPDYDVDFYQVDITKEAEIQKAFQEITSLDILVNNAGIYFQSAVEETTAEQLDKIIGVNFRGAYLVSKHAIPLILKSKGNVINISSIAGVMVYPETPAYCATKAAVAMLSRCMAKAYAGNGVRVNAILPGPIDTPLLRRLLNSEEAINQSAALNPMKKIGQPDDIANLAAFLASDEAGYITGGLYPVDGGESC